MNHAGELMQTRHRVWQMMKRGNHEGGVKRVVPKWQMVCVCGHTGNNPASRSFARESKRTHGNVSRDHIVSSLSKHGSVATSATANLHDAFPLP